jgi:hypothetical protein
MLQSPACQLISKLHKAYQLVGLFHNIRSATTKTITSSNLPVTSHGAHDVTVHLLAACPNRSYLEAHGFGLDRNIEHPLVLEQGTAIAPKRPGHG